MKAVSRRVVSLLRSAHTPSVLGPRRAVQPVIEASVGKSLVFRKPEQRRLFHMTKFVRASNRAESRVPEDVEEEDFREEKPDTFKIIAASTTSGLFNLRQLHERVHAETGLVSVYPPTTRPRVLYLDVAPGDQSTRPDAPSFAFNKYDLVKSYFWFEDGTVVAWGANDEEFKSLVTFTSGSGAQSATHFYERLQYRYSHHAGYDANKDLIYLDRENNIGEKLAFSHGIAKSVKLDALEHQIEDTVNEIGQEIPAFFLQGGRKPFLDSKYNTPEINKKIGKIMKLRWDLNVRTDIGETPEYLWEEEPKHERLYAQIEKALDIRGRMAGLNKKLKIADEDLEILNNYLSTSHGAYMELLIVILIAFEVINIIMEKFSWWHNFTWEEFFYDYFGWELFKKKDADASHDNEKQPQQLVAAPAK